MISEEENSNSLQGSCEDCNKFSLKPTIIVTPGCKEKIKTKGVTMNTFITEKKTGAYKHTIKWPDNMEHQVSSLPIDVPIK